MSDETNKPGGDQNPAPQNAGPRPSGIQTGILSSRIAPPVDGTAADGVLAGRVSRLMGNNLTIQCPRCGSTKTEKVSQFGSTPCKASYRCTDCLEPFDYFKCI